jgi:diguanylate cyclase (GGDEF)-like protein/PAS domain S-box-containing protein
MSTRGFVAAYLGVIAAAMAMLLLWPATWLVAVWAVTATAVAGIVVGVRRYRPQRTRAWLFLAAALVCNAAARVVYVLLPGQLGTLKPWVWVAFVLHLVMLVFLIAGFFGLAKSNVHGRVALIDATIVILGAGLVAGLFIALPYARRPGLTGLEVAVRDGYMLRDVIILAVLINFVTAVRWSSSALLLTIGVVALLSYDATVRLGQDNGTWAAGNPALLLWLLFLVAMGAAALVPSMASFDAPVSPDNVEVATLRLGLVAVAALLPSAVLIGGAFSIRPWYQPLLVGVATLVLVLVLVRVVDVAVHLRRQIRRERVLRDGIADLAASTDAAAVTTALDHAVRRLISPGASYSLTLTPSDTPGAEQQPVGGRGPTLAIPTGPASGRLETTTVDGLRPALGGGRPPTVLVRSDRTSLQALQPTLGALATQAGLTLERLRLQDEVTRQSRDAYFRTLVQNSAEAILIVDDNNRIQYASPTSESIFGRVPGPGVALPGLVDRVGRANAEGFLSRTRADAAAKPAGTDEWTVLAADGNPARVEVSVQDVRDDPTIGGLIVTLRDVTERRRLEYEVEQRFVHDSLTGLDNRLPFSDRLDAAMTRAATGDGLVGVLDVDLDDLKVINDGFGHRAGDVVLTTMGERMRNFVGDDREHARIMAARLGGDEFAVLLADLADQSGADYAAAQLVDTLGQPIDVGGHVVTCTASIGVATTSEDSDTATELLRNADLALYAAKGAGKGRWRHYESWMRRTVMARLELRSSLEHAIADGALSLEYQPIVDLEDGSPVGFEALLRWQHPTHGRLSPDQFIDVAEESGLIVPIGEWVLGTAMQAARNWLTGPDISPYIGVNVSARQFRTPGFLAGVRRLLADTGVPPQRLMLEITESLLLHDNENVWNDMQRLRAEGVRIAIDDFGTGYSALSYLRQIPLDVVKLDRTFIQPMVSSAQQRELIEGIVNLSRVLGLQVIAEGIETDTQRDLALGVGCTYGQGYLFSRPIPEEDARQWLLAQSQAGRPHE